ITGFDPLNEFGIGNLSLDVDMGMTCRELGRISRAGNPDRAVIILHHALTGREGAKKAFGMERAGFSRNSKVLHSWARAAINVVSANQDNNDTLLLFCAKNNDGKEFPPVAVQLNLDTMIYEVDLDFDISGWCEQIATTGKRREALKPQMLRECLIKGREYDLKELTAIVMEHFVVQKTCAYDMIR